MSQNPIDILLNRNKQWSQAVIDDDKDFFPHSAQGQSPKVLWFGCSDSRVPESLITRSNPGDLFVHRNIANQFHPHDDSALSVLSYALKVGVTHVVLVGHTQCGGAQACLDAVRAGAPHFNTPLGRWLGPLTRLVQSLDLTPCDETEAGDALTKIVEANVRVQVDNICKAVPIAFAWADTDPRQISVHGWVYHLAEGRIKELVSRDVQS